MWIVQLNQVIIAPRSDPMCEEIDGRFGMAGGLTEMGSWLEINKVYNLGRLDALVKMSAGLHNRRVKVVQ